VNIIYKKVVYHLCYMFQVQGIRTGFHTKKPYIPGSKYLINTYYFTFEEKYD